MGRSSLAIWTKTCPTAKAPCTSIFSNTSNLLPLHKSRFVNLNPFVILTSEPVLELCTCSACPELSPPTPPHPLFRRQADGGSWFYGGWRRGKRHGAGVELLAGSGARFEGVWRDGVRDNTLTAKEVDFDCFFKKKNPWSV
jgi:hypothetical protein